MKPFPIPVVALGPGSQTEETDLEYLTMPQGMQTYRAPVLPEPEEIANLQQAHAVLHEVQHKLAQALAGQAIAAISLTALNAENIKLVNQVLGEGEVSASLNLGEGHNIHIQESIFAGIWRVLVKHHARIVEDSIEIGDIPTSLRLHCTPASRKSIAIPRELPEGVMNAPSILSELNDQLQQWKSGNNPHVVNLSLLPLSEQDVAFLGAQLGGGNTLILSRGYGNCRISNTAIPHCWQLVYFNSQDNIILHTLEVTDVPEIACAAHEDLEDSYQRLLEVLHWLEAV